MPACYNIIMTIVLQTFLDLTELLLAFFLSFSCLYKGVFEFSLLAVSYMSYNYKLPINQRWTRRLGIGCTVVVVITSLYIITNLMDVPFHSDLSYKVNPNIIFPTVTLIVFLEIGFYFITQTYIHLKTIESNFKFIWAYKKIWALISIFTITILNIVTLLTIIITFTIVVYCTSYITIISCFSIIFFYFVRLQLPIFFTIKHNFSFLIGKHKLLSWICCVRTYR